jgi:outer membrane protein OmpA-like peptidoglycan-associated protein
LSVKPQDIEFDLISVTGETMANEIDKSGRVAVYGIYFDTDSANIKPDSATTLAEIARLLKLRPDLTLYIDGHTDDQGSDDYNLDLSKKRATAVVAALVEHHGVGSGRLEPRGLGESQPVAVNDSEEGRSWNRRVELVAR